MSHFFQDEYCTVIKRHKIIFFIKIIRHLFLVFVGLGIFFSTLSFSFFAEYPGVRLWCQIISFLLLNYWMLRIGLNVVKYYNYLLLIYGEYIIIIKASLFLRDDIELLNSEKINKVYQRSHGFLPNLLKYGDMVIEQQSDDTRIFNYMPNPSYVIKIINNQLMNNRKK